MTSMSKHCIDSVAPARKRPAAAGRLVVASAMLAAFSAALSAAGLVAGWVAFWAPSAMAAPAVESFDKATWPALLRTTKQPAIVVFTSVTCTHCPGAIASLARQRAAQASRTPLWVVSMDADDDASLLRDAHYAPADRLYAFRGNPQALQFSVNPDWRGMTPYVAFVDGKGGATFVLGEPKAAVLAGWLKAGR